MPDIVNPDDISPRYFQLANILRERISSGELLPHQPIPSERQMEDIYSVSRTTIRQALDLLERQGYVYREHGRGTFVSPQKLQKPISELTSFSEDMKRRGIEPGQKILSIGMLAPAEDICHHMEISYPHEPIFHVSRLRLGNGTPMGLQTSYYLLPDGDTISAEDLEHYGSIYLLLQEKLHIYPTEADETLEVTQATPAEASLLQIKPGSPLLLSERTTYSQNRQLIEFVKILYRADRYTYTARLTRS
jgi:GntR family transcriptional regulator